MADEQDRESKTEEPTEKRIADALQRGNVPVARELTLLGSIAGLLCAVLLAGGWAVEHLNLKSGERRRWERTPIS